MTDPERDAEVDAWLERQRPLLRAHDDGRSLEPPAELDRLVLQRAHLELRKPAAAKVTFFRNPRWTLPVSIAATVLLSFTLVLQFDRYESQRDAASQTQSAAATVTLTPAEVDASNTTQQSAAALQAPTSTLRSQSAETEIATARSNDKLATRGRTAQRADEQTLADSSRAIAAQSASPSVAGEFASSAPLEAKAAAAPAPKVAAEARREVADASDVAAALPERAVVTAARAPLDMAAAAAPPPVSVAPRSAASWWEQVQKLRRDGRVDDAERELKALRKAYPDFAIPTPP